MWPWEHVAFGYVWYSVFVHATRHESPSDRAAVAAVVATQMPDLIDKPLSWGLKVTASGYGPAHSLLVAGPALVVVAVVAARREHPWVGAAFVLGYLSHLVGDVIGLRLGHVAPGRLLWPVAPRTPYAVNRGLVDRTLHYVHGFLATSLDPEHVGLLVAYAGVFCLVGALWLYDGAPGVAGPLRWVFGNRSAPSR